MKAGILFFLSAALVLFLGFQWWRTPIGETERAYFELRERGRWQYCDRSSAEDRRFVLRLYHSISPALDFLRSVKNRRAFGSLEILAAPKALDKVVFLGWKELRERAESRQDLFDLKRWLQWEFEIKELIAWDQERMQGKFIGNGLLGFTRTDAVKKIGEHDFQLLLDAGDFPLAKEAFQKTIEQNWNQPPFSLHVVWADADPTAFKFVSDPVSPVAYVERDTRQIHLPQQITDGELVHQIGHVIGFADHYELSWNFRDCRISESIFLEDVMSNSSAIRAQHGHWQLLEAAYSASSDQGLFYVRSEVFLRLGERPKLAAALENICPQCYSRKSSPSVRF